MSQTTQCPACQTRFKVSDAHLALAGGMVRCGRCSHVFHAPGHFDAPQASPATQATPAPAAVVPQASSFEPDDDFELELPDFEPEAPPSPAMQAAKAPPANRFVHAADEELDLPDYELMQPAPEAPLDWHDLDSDEPHDGPIATPKPDKTPEEPDPDVNTREPVTDQAEQEELAAFQRALAEALTSGNRPARRIALFDENAPPPPVAVSKTEDAQDEFELRGRQTPRIDSWQQTSDDEEADRSGNHDDATQENHATRRTWLKNALLAGASTLGLVLLAAQLVFINRTTVSAQLPELRPAFESLCQQLGCDVPLPTQRQFIRTEWSELSFVPQHDHLIQLNATLRNLAPYPQALPLLELSLKDGDDQLIIRKTLKPQEYLSKNDLALGRFNANSELKIVTRMEVSQVKALGYSLHFYYP